MPVNETQNFTSHKQSAHNQALESSIAITLEKLKKIYWEHAVTDTMSTPEKAECIEKAVQRSHEKFEADMLALDAQSQDEAFHRLIAWILRHYKTVVKDVSGYEQFYRIKYYKDGKEQETFFMERDVFTLVWEAINDCDAYPCHPNTEEQRLKDLADRRLAFFTCLEQSQGHKLCPSGIRNNLVMLLNHTYKDIVILEDMNLAIRYIIRETAIPAFIEIYEKSDESEKIVLRQALYQWMLDSELFENFVDVLKIREKLTNIVERYLKENGIALSKPVIEKTIAEIIHTLPFSCNHDFIELIYVNELFNIETDDQTTNQALHAGLEQIKSWILTQFDLTNPEHKKFITYAYRLLKAYESLILNERLLKIQSLWVVDDIIDCSVVKKHLADALGQLPAYPNETDMQSLLSLCEKIESHLDRSKQYSFKSEIENFFAQWFSEQSHKKSYRLLFSEDFKKIVELTDEKIRIIQSMCEAADGSIHVGPREINQVLLHAILFHPKEYRWSDSYQVILKAVIHFIKDKFKDETNANALELLKHSYPTKLLTYIESLCEIALRQDMDETQGDASDVAGPRIDPVIILPNNANSLSKWSTLFYHIDIDQRRALLQNQFFSIVRSAEITLNTPLDSRNQFLLVCLLKALAFQDDLYRIQPENLEIIKLIFERFARHYQSKNDIGSLLQMRSMLHEIYSLRSNQRSEFMQYIEERIVDILKTCEAVDSLIQCYKTDALSVYDFVSILAKIAHQADSAALIIHAMQNDSLTLHDKLHVLSELESPARARSASVQLDELMQQCADILCDTLIQRPTAYETIDSESRPMYFMMLLRILKNEEKLNALIVALEPILLTPAKKYLDISAQYFIKIPYEYKDVMDFLINHLDISKFYQGSFLMVPHEWDTLLASFPRLKQKIDIHSQSLEFYQAIDEYLSTLTPAHGHAVQFMFNATGLAYKSYSIKRAAAEKMCAAILDHADDSRITFTPSEYHALCDGRLGQIIINYTEVHPRAFLRAKEKQVHHQESLSRFGHHQGPRTCNN